MENVDKTREQLIRELVDLRQRITELETLEAEHNRTTEMLKWEIGVNSAIAELSSALVSSQMPNDNISSLVLEHAKNLTKSRFGFVGYIDPQTGYLVCPTMTRDVWDVCQVQGKEPVFSKFSGFWGWVLSNRKPLLANRPAEDPRSSGTPPGHIPIHRVLSVPALIDEELVGQISVANSECDYTQRDQALLEHLADIYAITIQRRRTEEEHLKLSRAVEQSPSTIVITDTDGRIEYVNPRFTQITGYSMAEVMWENPSILKSGEMGTEEYKSIWDTLKSGGEWHGEFHNRKANGELYWESASISPIKNRRGEITHFVKVAEDITELKRSREELEKQRDRLAELVEERTAELRIINEQLQWNYDIQAAINSLMRLSLEDMPLEALLKHTLDVILSMHWLPLESKGIIFLIEDESEALIMKAYSNVEEEVRRTCARVPSGTRLCGRAALTQEVQFADSLDEDCMSVFKDTAHGHYCAPILYGDRTLGVINLYLPAGHHRDEKEVEFLATFSNVLAGITVQKQTEEALRKSQSSLAEAQRIARFGNWDWDISNNELHWSDEIYRIFGLNPQEFDATYEAFLNSVHPDDRTFVQESVDKARYEKKPYSIDHRIVLPDGSERIVHEDAEVFLDDTGQAVRMAGTIQDITGRRRAEEELEAQRVLSVRSDRLRSLGGMAAGIAHELNQPLVGVRGLAEHLLLSVDRGWELTEENIRDRARLIMEQADRMVHIIDHIRVFARDAGKPELRPVNVSNVVRSSMDMLGTQFRSRGIGLECELTEELPLISANPFSLEEVVINLLINARDAMEEQMQTGTGPAQHRILLRTFLDESDSQGYVNISVIDSGGGIPAAILDRIFDPFFTTKGPDRGTGLGLSISKSIVEEFGGTLHIQSAPDSGTTATISLPVEESHSQEGQ